MSEVIIRDGIGYAVNTQAVFMSTGDSGAEGKPFTQVKDPDAATATTPWALWGNDNQEPTRIADDLDNCGVLNAAYEAKTRIALGRGILPGLVVDVKKDGEEVVEFIADAEIQDWLDANPTFQHGYANMYNMQAYGWGASRFLLNRGRNYINRIEAVDVYNARIGRKDDKGYSRKLYICAEFDKVSTYDTNKVIELPLLLPQMELQTLENTSGYEYAMVHRLLKNGRIYYPRPLHKTAQAWVKLTRSIPAFKNALMKNQMFVRYVVSIDDQYWIRRYPNWKSTNSSNTLTEEQKLKIQVAKFKEINDYLTGQEQAGKTIIAGKYFDNILKQEIEEIKITVLDDKLKDGKLLPDSAASDKQILFALFFNPAIWGGNLLGDGASGGAGSGSDIREAFQVQIMLMHTERMLNLEVFNLIKHVNGWAKRLQKPRTVVSMNPDGSPLNKTTTPRLVFRYQSGLLTTLDTGKSSTSTTT